MVVMGISRDVNTVEEVLGVGYIKILNEMLYSFIPFSSGYWKREASPGWFRSFSCYSQCRSDILQ